MVFVASFESSYLFVLQKYLEIVIGVIITYQSNKFKITQGGHQLDCIMRLIDTHNMEVVSAGLPWSHNISPCSKQAIHLLERNTKVVTWFMPRGGASHEQVPCILYREKHFSLSLRMQKAIYRHVRLKKGFKNEETVNGMPKLRIPDLLLKEKIRTQSRFDVRFILNDGQTKKLYI